MNIGPLELLILLVLAGLVVPFIWALIDAIRRPESQYPNGRGKTAWILGLVLGWTVALGWLVGIIYLINVRQKQGPIRPDGLESTDAPPQAPT